MAAIEAKAASKNPHTLAIIKTSSKYAKPYVVVVNRKRAKASEREHGYGGE